MHPRLATLLPLVMAALAACGGGDRSAPAAYRVSPADSAAAAEAETARRRTLGELRVRVLDTRTGQPGAVSFSLSDPAVGLRYGPYTSKRDGAALPDSVLPGTWDIHLFDVTCRGRTWYARDMDDTRTRTAVGRVVVPPGGRVEKEIRLDVCAVPEAVGVEGAEAEG
jgi:hypothetical protein